MFIPQRSLLIFFFLACVNNVVSQEKKAGPVIKDYGKVWQVQDPDYILEEEFVFKAVFDVMNSPDSHDLINPSIETVARYLNMHAQSGVSVDNLKAVVVIHNKASKDIMNDAAYQSRYGVENPNRKLLEELIDSGVDVIFCGQSSLSRDIPKEDIIEEVQLSLSAMTALIQLQDKGYKLIKF